MDDRRRQSLAWPKILGWALSLVALVFVGKLLQTTDPGIWPKLRDVHLGLALLSLGIFQIWFLLRFWCWEIISQHYGMIDQRTSHLRMWMVSEFMRYLPGNVWSFVARYRGARQRGGSRGGATISLLIEAINMVAGAALVTAMFLRPEFWAIWLVAAAAYVIVVPSLIQIVARWRRWEFSHALRYGTTVKLLALSVLLWIVYGLAQAIIIKALPGVSTPNMIFLVGANVAAWLIGYLSIITPMGLGVREVALASFLASSVADGVGSILAVLTRVWLIISELVFLGLVLIVHRRR